MKHLTYFSFTIPYNEYAQIKPIEITGKWKLQENWTDLFAKYFNNKNADCNIMFKKHRVSQKHSAHSNYITAEGYCNREFCSAYYYLRVKSVPKKEKDVTVSVRYVFIFLFNCYIQFIKFFV